MRADVTVKPDKDRCCSRAIELFIRESGVAKEGSKYERMREDAFRVRDEIASRVDVKGTYSFYDEFDLDGQVIRLEGAEFSCTAFEQLDRDSLEGVYFYAVTAGDYYLEKKPLMDQLYADIWGTAFTDAMREELMDVLKEKSAISDSFGPGFYGMDVAEMLKMPFLVDFAGLGIEIKESGILLPLKSCAGIVFKVNGKYKGLNAACRYCFGSRKTCTLCAMRSKCSDDKNAGYTIQNKPAGPFPNVH